jgi:hypothetical protein
MSPLHQKPYKHRGTIIVDANVINHLFCEVKPERQNPHYPQDKRKLGDPQSSRIAHYLGILEFLAKHGFRIVVPEMVAVETGSVLASGVDMMKHAGIPREQMPIFHDPQLQKILQRAAKNRYFNVAIVEMSSDSEQHHEKAPARFMMAARKITKYLEGSEKAKEHMRELRQRYRRDLGEKAILSYIRDTHQENREDVFVLSDDKEALHYIGEQCHVPVLNLKGMLRPFIDNGLHKAVGLRDDISANAIMRDCSARRMEISGQKHTPKKYWTDQHWKAGVMEPVKDVFRKKMKELASDMEIGSWQERVRASRGEGTERLH